MPPSAEEIRHRLAEFAAKWGGYQGSERAEAQTFLNELFACYGVDRQDVGARFEEPTGGKFVDLLWPEVCLFEMKRPSEAEKLNAHRAQAIGYWNQLGKPGAPAPTWVVLCAFHRFEVWKPGEVYREPLAVFDLAELPENADALLFLAGKEPGFYASDELTREAVALLTDVYGSLDEREAADDDVLHDFVLQVVWSMFAEDLGMLPEHIFTRLLDGLTKEPGRSSADDLGRLFRYLAEPEPRPEHGAYAGTPYANGGLFGKPAEVHLNKEEVGGLREACDFDWTQVEPAIFGSLLTGALGKEKQWALGAHYTSEADIMKVVVPTIVEPWRERIAACDSVKEAKAAQQALASYVVLDPACGSGNFLYVAYRELRLIEDSLRRKLAELRKAAGLPDQAELALFPITNMKGIEIEPFAVKLARVTMWIGHKLAVDRLGVDEPVLPLVDLTNTIQRADALRVVWPAADAIVSNPPYHGSQRLRGELGDEYVEWLKEEFGIGVKDFAAYWFRKAHPHLPEGGRAGLVVTNSISQNKNRGPTLEWIIKEGAVITDAIASQDWSGEAAVDVSIVNWIKGAPGPGEVIRLDGERVSSISAALRSPEDDVSSAVPLAANRGHAFQGPIPVGQGFLLEAEEAHELLDRPDADYRQIVRRYLVGDDIANQPRQLPTRWIIDFGSMSLEEAGEYPAALALVRERVKPERDVSRDEGFRANWWRFGRPRGEMRTVLDGLSRYVAGMAQGKRVHFCWQSAEVCRVT